MREQRTREKVLDRLGWSPTNVGAIAAALGVTTQAVLHHLGALRAAGMVRQTGSGRGAKWERVFAHLLNWDHERAGVLGESAMWAEAKALIPSELALINEPTRRVLDYTVTEILNNAIDHSFGSAISLRLAFDGKCIDVVVSDDGIGAFRKVREFFRLANDMEAIAHIAKGRQTTAPTQHTGQGLFFCSRMVDQFEVESNGRLWKVDNLRDDATIAPATDRPGTRVTLRTSMQGRLSPKEVFDKHSIEEFAFDRGVMRVALIMHGNEFISRSEAKRLATGLELYGAVELDFNEVTAVGQGFVDELFRVWINAHPGTTITYVNASDEVKFMIERGLPGR